MERNQLSTLAARFKRAISESKINALGRAVQFSYRERIITPYRLVMALLVSLSTGRVETLADFSVASMPCLAPVWLTNHFTTNWPSVTLRT